MGDGKKLSSLDASFLYLETPEMPMHVGSMAIFLRLPADHQGDFFEDFKAMIASRLHLAPILKARLEKAPLDIDHPSWVEDDQFEIPHRRHLPLQPAGAARPRHARAHRRLDACETSQPRPSALGVLCLRRHEGQRDRALFQDASRLHRRRRGCGAHQHDLRHLAGPAPSRAAEARNGKGRPGAARHRRQPARFLSVLGASRSTPAAARGIELPRSGKSDLGSILFDNAMFQIESAVKFAGSVPSVLKSVSEVVGKISDPKSRDSIASMVSPSTILNKSISSERSFAGVSIPLSQAKALAKQAGGKLNDVVLAISSGVVRRYLLEQRRAAGEVDDRRGADLVARRGQHRRQQSGVRHDLRESRPTSRIPRRGSRPSSRNPPSPRKCRIRCGR